MTFVPNLKTALLALAVCVVSSTVFAADDKDGCKDSTGLKRFEGAALTNCWFRNLTPYGVVTGSDLTWDEGEGRLLGPGTVQIEGRRNWLQYNGPEGSSSEEMVRFYRKQLPLSGYKILYEPKRSELKLDTISKHMRFAGCCYSELRYLAAEKVENGTRTYLAIGIANYDDHLGIAFFDVLNGSAPENTGSAGDPK